LAATAPPHLIVVALGSDDLDITDAAAVRARVTMEAPDIILNAAAYTMVDSAEAKEAKAYAVNAEAVQVLAEAGRSVGAQLVHLSTDFVFDGRSTTPYPVDALPAPLSAYGRTKLAGERAAGGDALIVRTAWVHAAGGDNFVHTMLRLMASASLIRVVSDQIGTPTHASSLARAIWSLAGQGRAGIYHFTDSGAASWYDFAVAIQEEALAIGLLDDATPVLPVMTADYPTPAVRPSFSLLDKTKTWAALGEAAPHWRANLRRMLSEIKAYG
jgi:dTDP-4-dehydrorhamnose reductase